jgi:ABC-type Mn2+/Zn2+ transport system ATPase subunit
MPGRVGEQIRGRTMGYRGARFYKADLQVGTPADPIHWGDVGCRFDAAKPEASALQFVRACYEAGLEIVGITDHNFASKDYFPVLRAAARSLAGEYDHEIVLMPGFEIQADVGRGCHVLALFEPGHDLDEIDHLVTQCGIPYPRHQGGAARPSTKRLPEILEVVQRRSADGRLHGIVILPHSQSDAGIFDTDRIADWLQQAEFTNGSLFAIEVPKPPRDMSAGWQRLLRAGEDCDSGWRRQRPIACVMSSDAKAITPGTGPTNYLGARWSWIKMSEPSVEGLRQAFLDPESRIRLMGSRPEEEYLYPTITSLSVAGAGFLSDLEVDFSKNLNTLIGGGGTGKSTIIEYLRIALGQAEGVVGDAKANLERLRSTIRPDTRIAVRFQRDGKEWTVTSTGGVDPVVEAGDAVPDLRRFMPVRIYSQHEIYAIAGDREARSKLLDNLVREDLDRIDGQTEDLVAEIRQLDARIQQRPSLSSRLVGLDTEILDLTGKLERLEAAEGVLKASSALAAESAALKMAEGSIQALVAEARANVDRWSLATAGLRRDANPHPEAMEALADRLEQSLGRLREVAQQAVAAFADETRTTLESDEIAELRQNHAAAKAAQDARRAELLERGIDPEAYDSYAERLRAAEESRLSISGRLAELDALGPVRSGKILALRGLWAQQSSIRAIKASELTGIVRKTATGRPFVEVDVLAFGDTDLLFDESHSWLRDRRRLTEDDMDEFVDAVINATAAGCSPTDTMVEWVGDLRAGTKPAGFPWASDARETKVLLELMDPPCLAGIELLRIPDKVTIKLYRQDGSVAGELEEGLSVGQRCTAILAVLLAQDEAPALIDQPEDDLDNEFTYRDLVPLIRQSKEQRQLVVATHDPNIPVNGDAELIVALEARNGRGSVKVMDGVDAIGALDKSSVCAAVEEIMEGSEEAFRKRFEKYGF